MSWVRLIISSLRLTFRWSNSTQASQERLGDLTLAIAVFAAVVIWSELRLDWWQVLLVWVACLVPALLMNRKGWLKVFGPVLYYDMIRQARRSRFIAFRFLYALALVLVLYSAWTSTMSGRHLDFIPATGMDWESMIAQSYFEVFLVVQFVVVGLLTPVYVAGAISEEKEQKTLEYMLATDLLNREIVLSKLVCRTGNLALFVLTGLPIISILQFLGGIDPNLVFAAFAVTGLTIASLAGVSILCSVYAKTSARAIALTYVFMIAFYALPPLLRALAPDSFLRSTLWFGMKGEDIFKIHAWGSINHFLGAMKDAGALGTLAAVLPVLVRDYAIVHGTIGVVCTALAIARLRTVASRQIAAKPIKARVDFFIWSRPRIGSNALLWKELHCGGSKLPPWAASIWVAVKLVGTFLPALLIVCGAWAYYDFGRHPLFGYEARALNWWVSMANTVVGCLIILTIAARASTSISKERDKQTLNTLLTTPFSTRAILQAKLAGSLLSVRLGMVWLAVIWAAAFVSGTVKLEVVLIIIPIWTIYAVFAAVLGLWYSTVSRSSLRATVVTMLMLVGLSVGPVAASWVFGDLAADSRETGSISEGLGKSLLSSVSPPVVLFRLPFSSQDEMYGTRVERTLALAVYPAGVVLWLLGSIMLYQQTCSRFRWLANRMPRKPRSYEDGMAMRKGRGA